MCLCNSLQSLTYFCNSLQSLTYFCNSFQLSTCLCNSHSQTCPCYSQPQTCLCNSHRPCSPQYCHLHYQPVLSLRSLSPLSLCHHQNLHQRSLSTSSRPFQKKRSQLNQDSKESRRLNFLYLRLYHQRDYNSWRLNWNEEQEEIFNQKWTWGFRTLLNVWPFHLMEVDNQGRSQFWLTHLEKERLQSLGLSNLFPMNWSASGPQHIALGRCKKSLT